MIRFASVSKHLASSARPAVDALDLSVPEGTTCVLLGPSGCGKSTALQMVEPDHGRILLATPTSRPPTSRRRRRAGRRTTA